MLNLTPENELVPQYDDLRVMAEILAESVRKLLKVKGDISLSSPPEFNEKKIVQFRRRMRVDGLEKFGERTVFSAVNFYIDKSHMDEQKAIGALVIYIPASYVGKLLWLFDYDRIDEDDDEMLLDGCGTICNLIAGHFVKDLRGLGYVHLEMSSFQSFINTALNGIEFFHDQKTKCEVDFYIKMDKRLVAEITMGPVPRY